MAEIDFEMDTSGIDDSGGGGGDLPAVSDGGAPPSPGIGSPAGTPPPAAPSPWDTPPKSWKAEMHQHYASTPAELRQYIHEREKQALEGIMRYKGMADPYHKVNSKYQKAFEHYNVKPEEVYERMLQSHLALTMADPETKKQYALQLIKDYGLDQVLGLQQNPGFRQTEALQPLMSRLQNLERGMTERQQAEAMAAVDKFLADPKNEFVADVADDMKRLLDAGLASTLEDAYATAVWQNPATRQKLIQREIEKTAVPQKAGPKNVRPSNVPPAAAPSGTGDIEADMAAIYDRLNS